MERKISRRERAKKDKMRRILAASTRLFALHGFDGTTVQQIADEADVAVGTLFLYVLDKGEILLLLFHRAIEQQLEKATKELSGPGDLIQSITRFLVKLIIPYENNPDLSRVFWREFLFHKGKVRQDLDAQATTILQVLQDRIVVARNAKEIDRDVDPEAAALQIYAIYHSVLAFHLAGCLPGASPRDTLAAMLQSMWKGLQPRIRTRQRGAPRRQKKEAHKKRTKV